MNSCSVCVCLHLLSMRLKARRMPLTHSRFCKHTRPGLMASRCPVDDEGQAHEAELVSEWSGKVKAGEDDRDKLLRYTATHTLQGIQHDAALC